jgi:hypothetical protein
LSTRHLRLAGAATLALGALCASVLPASAVAGNPGVPSDPIVLLAEGFDTGLTPETLTLLEDYVPAFPTTYSADDAWLSQEAGNGLIIDGNTTDAEFDTTDYDGVGNGGRERMRELATALGEVAGKTSGEDNFAVTAYTDLDPGANQIEFETTTPLALDAGGRFLTLSANVAALNCVRASAPALVFYLVDGNDETRVNSSALNPCRGASNDEAYATRLLGGNAALFSGDTVGIVLRNENGSGGGNDHAYDDITLLDVTPQLDKKFTDEGRTLTPGTVTNLVLTVTNTSELSEKDGWSFTDHLPAGLTVAGEADSECDATVTGAVGATSVVVEDGILADGEVSCEITVPVTSQTGGTFENSAANIQAAGLNLPGTTSIAFSSPPVPLAPVTGLDGESPWLYGAASLAGAALLVTLGLQVRRNRERAA